MKIAEPVKVTADIAAAGVSIGALIQWLPPIAALFTIVWTAIRIWETETVKRWRRKRPFC